LYFNSSQDIIIGWIDQDKFEKIINNLLSNALKFTSEGGKVEIQIEFVKTKKEIKITISDSGIGIPVEHQSNIFDRFFQGDDSAERTYKGSGIGLALVKELVDLHHWRIEVQSIVGNGSKFNLIIPEGANHLAQSEIYSQPQEMVQERKIDKVVMDLPVTSEKQSLEQSKKMPLILIVEDSTDVRIYLNNILQNEFRVLQAKNSIEGLKLAAKEMPDLIVSDIMMPGMDGLDFCRKIKSNLQTSHIPVILLTAKANIESKLEGLETGADDYLTKPFNYSELLIRIKNLLTQRQRLRDKFSNDLIVQPSNVTDNSLDKEFLKKAIEITENNLNNSDFESEEFAKELFISRSQLHRKLLAITGFTPGEFLRNIRIKNAARMLLEKRLSVTQIAFEVGFSSPSHFTKAFKKQFNCLPSEFIDKSRI